MKREEALEIVKKQLTERRYVHTIGVMETAIKLARQYGADEEKAELAAIFHDYAKFRPIEEMKEIVISENMASELLEYGDELLHAPVGAYLVQKEVGITDREVLAAISHHTSGRVNMTLLDKIVYLADYIEPGRSFPGVAEVRQLAKESLDTALLQSVSNTLAFLVKNNQAVYPDTFHFYNALILQHK
ncbi:bis(5'-nucleosyl)-tetraphosphatase (symmetrical) YqeK [Peribacillus sp. JNUCC 23]|uniref:bis(5'-nucleosyl)-tetraphosphatase (symmetrical) YqeK n=1 Tax=Peribacillus sp. NPDC096379 TaxID=3364393 RepID=UPI0007830F43